MALTTLEILKAVEASVSVAEGFRWIEAEEITPLSECTTRAEMDQVFTIFAKLDKHSLDRILGWDTEGFVPLAKIAMNTLAMNEVLDLKDQKGWKPVLSVASKMLAQYINQYGENFQLAYELSEEMRLFDSQHHNPLMFNAIVKLHRTYFDQFDVSILCDIAKSSNDLRRDMHKDSQVREVFAFSCEKVMSTLRWEELHNTPFVSSLLLTCMSTSDKDAPSDFSSIYSNTYKGLHRLTDKLLRFEGLGLHLPCVHTDYLLVAQLVDRYRKLYNGVKDPVRRDRFVRACTVLVDLIAIDSDQPLDMRRNVYQRRPGGLSMLSSTAPSILTKEFADIFDTWPSRSPFMSAMVKVRRAVVGSTLLAMDSKPGYFKNTSEGDLKRMLLKSTSDLKDPAFHVFIKKQGRKAVAERISELDNPALKKQFLMACRDVRGQVLEADLGL